MGEEAPEVLYVNGSSKVVPETQQNHVNNVDGSDTWYEEVIDDDLKWSFKLNRFVYNKILPPVLYIRKNLFFRFIKNMMYLDYKSV
jgi:hypothetical protein